MCTRNAKIKGTAFSLRQSSGMAMVVPMKLTATTLPTADRQG